MAAYGIENNSESFDVSRKFPKWYVCGRYAAVKADSFGGKLSDFYITEKYTIYCIL